ncbi:MAG: N-acetylglucosamine-6-phosphate deacetylase [Planctomycetes bacterium]|jgi:N-acetylglucosamine-6-phosphate deacetylase|nr:N-acetylglucosamine-6-phosphate deacetylase [Planctomycetota bacterium]
MTAPSSSPHSAELVVLPDHAIAGGDVHVDAAGRILSVAPGVGRPRHNGWLLPGFVDLQVNGFGGVDVATAPAEDLHRLGQKLVATGVTSFLPTLISAPIEILERQLARVADALEAWPVDAARALGIHLEGPFLNPKRRGAHAADDLSPPDIDTIEVLMAAARGRVRLVTMAPELDGAGEVIDWLVKSGVRVAIGHSEATVEEAEQAITRGATLCTHFGNAMSSIHQRAPGIQTACLLDDRITAGVIGDLVHVHPALLRLLVHNKGASGVALVTDAIAATGLGEGTFSLSGVEVTVRDGVSRDAAGALAGSVLAFDEALRRFAEAVGADPTTLARTAASNAARAIGADEDVGSLEPGRWFDAVVWRDGVDEVWIAGKRVA